MRIETAGGAIGGGLPLIASSLRAGWGLKLPRGCALVYVVNCIQPSGWMRIETFISAYILQFLILHPAFGLDEDWNLSYYHRQPVIDNIASSLRAGWGLKHTQIVIITKNRAIASSLRAGWGLKRFLADVLLFFAKLHPAFGLDEDWNNWRCTIFNLAVSIASSLRAGWGLKQALWGFQSPYRTIASSLRAGWGLKLFPYNAIYTLDYCIQPSGWMRIETASAEGRHMPWSLHPAFGLDEDWNWLKLIFCRIIALHPAFGLDEDWNFKCSLAHLHIKYCIQPSGWMRIETASAEGRHMPWSIASSLRAGWGLKQARRWCWQADHTLHPAFGLDEDWNS